MNLRFIYARVVRDKQTGFSKGYAFVKLSKIEDAVSVVDRHYESPIILGGEPILLDYSAVNANNLDWTCQLCGAYNFERRDRCFKCFNEKEVAISGNLPISMPDKTNNDGTNDINPYPSRFLLVRNISPTTKEPTIFKTFSMVNKEVIRVVLMKEMNTHCSMCYAFAEYPDHCVLMKKINNSTEFAIEGRNVSVYFGRDLSYRDDGVTSGKWPVYWDPLIELSFFPDSPPIDDPLSKEEILLKSAPVIVPLEVTLRLEYQPMTGQYKDPVTGHLIQQQVKAEEKPILLMPKKKEAPKKNIHQETVKQKSDETIEFKSIDSLGMKVNQVMISISPY
ncbi:hypothetical protein ROZALSC1DRAFT_21662 [Rozella allomycis CSF55]|uniref:RanBP2-type domain-containing protein n=1 Tax=Rozella allomycis (strain CSF55) TaxID=988480 RepID=A0A4P9YLU5_ROZAC|nr:hypothetical protein ROZALSC1DRAFT_21662 [Rozella allomycis CSF55]